MSGEELLREEIKKSFQMEMIGAGVYLGLSKQYGWQDAGLGRILLDISEQEAMHARLYNGFYRKTYGEPLRGRLFWKTLGRVVAFAMRPIPLHEKLKRIRAVEQQAVEKLQAALSKEYGSDYGEIVTRILPDEMAHADQLVGCLSALPACENSSSFGDGKVKA